MTKTRKRLPLHIRILIALVLGVGWALLSSTLGWSRFTMDWIAPFGDIFINLLKLIAVPLVLFSIISGVADAEPDRIRSLVYLDALIPEDGDSSWSMTNDEEHAWYISGSV